MKDLTKIKKKLIENVREYQDTIKRNKNNGIDIDDQEDVERFNAAKYLFISTGLSKLFPDVKESKIIAQFNTPWPKQSYCRVKDVSKQYSKKSSALTRSASILIIFFAGQFLNMPSGFQDVIIHVSSTAAIGYVILVHIQLYQLFPALVILPLCIIGIIVHFIITSGKADAKLRLAKLFPARTNDLKDCVVYDQRQTRTNNHPSSSSEANMHQTRRASLQLGLNVIDEIHQIESSNSEKSSSDSDENDHEASDDDDDDDDDDDRSDDDDDDDDGDGSDDDDGDHDYDDDDHEGSDDDDVDSDDDSADVLDGSVDYYVYSDYCSNSHNETNNNNIFNNNNNNNNSNNNYNNSTSTDDSVSFDMEDSNASDGNDKSIFNENGYNSNDNIQDIIYTCNTNSIDGSLQNDLISENSSVDSICYDSVSGQSSIIIEKLEVNAIGSSDEKIVTPDKGCDFFEADTVSNEYF
jgi:hypothetical protein